ncbi:LamG domain-containing protein [Paraburkholderia aspalathi]|nr:LamG domain-containing protein [Paraburkholderia aspalathi]
MIDASKLSGHVIAGLKSGTMLSSKLSGHVIVGPATPSELRAFPIINTVFFGSASEPDLGDPYWDKVVLRLPFDTDFKDYSLSNHTLDKKEAVISQLEPKFAGNADLTTFYRDISIPDSPDFDFGSGDFTVELWYMPKPFPTGNTVIGKYRTAAPASRSWEISATPNSKTITIFMSSGNGAADMVSNEITNAIERDVWHHLCLERSGGTVRFYINGVMKLFKTVGTVAIYKSDTPVKFNMREGSTDSGTLFSRFDDVRITKGVARYNSNAGFPVPTEAYPLFGPPPEPDLGDPHWSKVVLRQTFDEDLRDYSNSNHWTSSNATVSNEFEKFSKNAHASYGRALTIANSDDFDFGAGDFTVEFWYYGLPNVYGGTIMGKYETVAPNVGRSWEIGTGVTLSATFYMSSDNLSPNMLSVTLDDFIKMSGWTHVCLERKDGVARVYKNGIMLHKQSDLGTKSIHKSTIPLTMGKRISITNSNTQQGRYDDVRITKGVARYASDDGFPVPIEAYPTFGPPAPE